MASPNDPSGFVRNPPSVIVKIQNTSQASVNGKFGIVVQYLTERSRYMVHLTDSQQSVALKPENLVKANMLQQAKAQYQQLSKNPEVRREITKYYNLAVSKLPQGVKPEYAAGGVGVLLLLIVYFVGFTRVLMILSMVLLLGVIVAPDLMSGSSPRVMAANFPSRCRANIEQSVPFLHGKVNDKVAAGLVLFFLAMTTRSLFLPSVSSKAAATANAARSAATTTTGGSGGGMSSVSVEEAYRFGFNDADSGKEFGTSLPAPTTTTTSSRGMGGVYDPLLDVDEAFPPLYDTMMPPPSSTSWSSKLGIWQMMSLMNIARTVYIFGQDAHGVFSPQLAVVNLQQADPMKLGLLGFSVYNVIKIFF